MANKFVTRVFCILSLLVSALATPARAQDWQAGAGEDWKQLLERARKEGRVVVTGDADMARPFSDGFKRDTGISVDFLAGNPRDLSSRMTRELRARNVTIDIMIGGPANIPLHKEGLIKAIRPQLLLPTVLEPKYWTDGRIKWIDNDQAYMLMGAEYVHGDPFYNLDKIKPGELTSWGDLMKPQYKGKIAAVDPRSQGPGQAAAAYIAHLRGYDFVRDLYIGQNVTLTREPRQLIEWAARGVAWILLGASSTDLERFRANGVKNVEVSDLADGPGSLLGGFSIVWQPVGSPNPNAAAVFLNWYASKPGQEAFMAVIQINF